MGAVGDYDFSSLKGDVALTNFGNDAGREKMSSAWSFGGRAGVLITPNLLTYFSAGYTEANFDQTNFTSLGAVTPSEYINKSTYKGYYLGAGDEYALNFLPGLFWKTEYRVSEFDRKRNEVYNYGTVIPTGESVDSKKWVQTVRTELIYRFNWSGPVVAKY